MRGALNESRLLPRSVCLVPIADFELDATLLYETRVTYYDDL